jgi:hypothetical protein
MVVEDIMLWFAYFKFVAKLVLDVTGSIKVFTSSGQSSQSARSNDKVFAPFRLSVE